MGIIVIKKGNKKACNEIRKQLSLILKNQKQMADELKTLTDKVTELDGKIDTLQATVDLEQQQISDLLATNAAVVSGLNQQIVVLQGQIANGATPEQLQSVSDSLAAIAAKVDAASADVASTV